MLDKVYLIIATTNTVLTDDLTFGWVESIWSTDKGANYHLLHDIHARYIDDNYWVDEKDDRKVSYRVIEREIDNFGINVERSNSGSLSIEQVLEMMKYLENYAIEKKGSPGNEIYSIIDYAHDIEANYYVRNDNWSYNLFGIQDCDGDSKEINIDALNRLSGFIRRFSEIVE